MVGGVVVVVVVVAVVVVVVVRTLPLFVLFVSLGEAMLMICSVLFIVGIIAFRKFPILLLLISFLVFKKFDARNRTVPARVFEDDSIDFLER